MHLFFLYGACRAWHWRSADCGCNARILLESGLPVPPMDRPLLERAGRSLDYEDVYRLPLVLPWRTTSRLPQWIMVVVVHSITGICEWMMRPRGRSPTSNCDSGCGEEDCPPFVTGGGGARWTYYTPSTAVSYSERWTSPLMIQLFVLDSKRSKGVLDDWLECSTCWLQVDDMKIFECNIFLN